jgi:signal transduction histidine kinase/CHASE3 domain sensor protein
MKIKQKLGLSFGGVFIAILIMGAVLWWSLEELSWRKQRLVFSYSNALMVRTLDSQISRQMKEVFDIILTGNKEDIKEFEEHEKLIFIIFDKLEALAHEELKFLIDREEIEEIEEEKEALQELADIKEIYEKILIDVKKILMLQRDRSPTAEFSAILESIEGSFEEILAERIHGLEIQEQLEIKNSLAKANEFSRRVKIISLIICGFTLALIVGIIYITGIVCTEPIMKLKETAVQIGKGDFETQVDIKSKDEIGDLARNIEVMRGNVKDRTEALEKVNAERNLLISELQAASKYKSEFLANVSHELKTPLNSLLVFSQMLSENEEKNLNDKQRKFVETIYRSGSSLLRMVNDLIDLTNMEAGKLKFHLEEVSLSELEKYANNMFQPLAEQQNVCFETEIKEGVPAHIKTDYQRVGKVLENLLSNAFKFTEEGKIALIFHPVEPMDRCTRSGLDPQEFIGISISDTGIGIHENVQDQIFESFRQEDGSFSRKYGGLGLGLTISKTLVILLGGEIWLESEEDVGSTFTIYLPKRTFTSKPTGEKYDGSHQEPLSEKHTESYYDKS